MFNFEKMETWPKTIQFADLIDRMKKDSPDHKRIEPTMLTRRSVTSILSEVAQGTSRDLREDSAAFLEMATRSLVEIVSQSFFNRSQGFPNEQASQAICTAAEDQSRMFSRLRRSLDCA